MTLQNSIDKLMNAIEKRKPKEIVSFRFREYMKVYDNLEPDASVFEKVQHKEVCMKYWDYVYFRGDCPSKMEAGE